MVKKSANTNVLEGNKYSIVLLYKDLEYKHSENMMYNNNRHYCQNN